MSILKAFIADCVKLLSNYGINTKTAKKFVRTSIDKMTKKEYENVIDEWKTNIVGDSYCAKGAVNQILKSIDEDNKTLIKNTFVKSVRDKDDFDKLLDEFIKVCPKGFSKCKLDGGLTHSSGKYREGESEKIAQTRYTFYQNDKWYCIYICYCYRNTKNEDEVGIQYFYIENLEANALDEDYENIPIICNIKSENDVTAHLIGNRAYVFVPTPDRKLTVKDIENARNNCEEIGQIKEIFGEPNVKISPWKNRYFDYYYELVSNNGEPLYAQFHADSISGELFHYCLLTDKKLLNTEERKSLLTDK